MVCVQIWRPSLSRRGIFWSSPSPFPPASAIGAPRAAFLLGVSLLSSLLVLALPRLRSLLLGQWWTRHRTQGLRGRPFQRPAEVGSSRRWVASGGARSLLTCWCQGHRTFPKEPLQRRSKL